MCIDMLHYIYIYIYICMYIYIYMFSQGKMGRETTVELRVSTSPNPHRAWGGARHRRSDPSSRRWWQSSSPWRSSADFDGILDGDFMVILWD